MRRPDPQRSYAVLIGTSHYQSAELQDLPSVHNNLIGLSEVLTDLALGGLPADRCIVLEDVYDIPSVYRTLREYARRAEDTLIVYFAGHGQVNSRNELYLGLTGTQPDELSVSALSYELVREVFGECRAANRVLILDCCFSGMAVQGMGADTTSSLVVDGTYILTATAATAVALAPPGEAYTAFTGALLTLLRNGVPGGPEYLTFGLLYPQLLRTMTERRLPKPQQRGTGLVDQLALTRNAAFDRAGPPIASPALPEVEPPRSRARTKWVSLRIAAAVLAVLVIVAAVIFSNSDGTGSRAVGGIRSSQTAQFECPTGALNGAGSSAQTEAMAAWTAEYRKRCAMAPVYYNATSSAAGFKEFVAGAVDFAGYDGALSDSDSQKATCQKLVLPMVVRPIAVVHNLDVDLQLHPNTLAKIFSGAITTWDAREIKADNPGVRLPSTPITPVHRADDTLVNAVFTGYLAATAPSSWNLGSAQVWRTSAGIGAVRSDGVTSTVKGTPGSIGYVEWPYAKEVSVAKLGHGIGGGFTALSADAAARAVDQFKISDTGDNLTLNVDYTLADPASYPLVMVVYEIACAKPARAGTLPVMRSFLNYILSSDVQRTLPDLGYAPLPETLRGKVEATVRKPA